MPETHALTHPERRSKGKEPATKDRPEKGCLCCGRNFSPKKSWQDFCQPECKLISWCANRFLSAFKAGKANGLRDIIKELSKAAKR